MPTEARLKEVRDAAVAKILAAWTDRGASDAVTGVYRIDLDAATVTGRKVFVFPVSVAGRQVDRTEDENDYALGVWVVERYEPQGDPPDAWLDARLAWVEWLWKTLGNPRGARLLADPGDPNSGLWPAVAEITAAYDHDELAEGKLFASVLTVIYREHVEGP